MGTYLFKMGMGTSLYILCNTNCPFSQQDNIGYHNLNAVAHKLFRGECQHYLYRHLTFIILSHIDKTP